MFLHLLFHSQDYYLNISTASSPCASGQCAVTARWIELIMWIWNTSFVAFTRTGQTVRELYIQRTYLARQYVYLEPINCQVSVHILTDICHEHAALRPYFSYLSVRPRRVRLLKFRTLDWPLLSALLLIWSCRLLALTELLGVLWLVVLPILRLFHDFSDRHAMVLDIHDGRLTAEVLWRVTHDVRPTPGECSESCYTRGIAGRSRPGGLWCVVMLDPRGYPDPPRVSVPYPGGYGESCSGGIAGRSLPGRGGVHEDCIKR